MKAGDFTGETSLYFKSTVVAQYADHDARDPGVACGVETDAGGRHVAVGVAIGDGRVFAALLTPIDAEHYADLLIRAAAEARSEGRA